MKKANYSSMRTAIARISKTNKLNMDNEKLGLKAGDTLTYSKDDIQQTLEDWAKNKKMRYYMIEHNENPDNIHYHIVLWFDSPTKFKDIKSKFEYGDIQKIQYGIKNCVRYLWHAENPEKHQYSPDEVVTNAPDKLELYKVASGQSEKARLEATIANIVSGKIQECDIDKIDPIIYSKYRNRIKYSFEYYTSLQLKNPSKNIKIIVLQGMPGAGKTATAKIIAELQNKTISVSSCSNDPLQDYKLGFDYLLLDDFDHSTFKINDFKKLLDNNTKSTSKKRYGNVYINSDIMIATNDNFLDWYPEATETDLIAIRRRVNCIMDFLPLQEDKVARYYKKSIADLHRDREKMQELNGNEELYQQYLDETYELEEIDLKKYISFEDNDTKMEEFYDLLKRL